MLLLSLRLQLVRYPSPPFPSLTFINISHPNLILKAADMYMLRNAEYRSTAVRGVADMGEEEARRGRRERRERATYFM